MSIGTSDGEYYEDRFDYLTRSYQQQAEGEEGREQVPLYRGGKDVTPKQPVKPQPTPEGGPKGIYSIDREHHVPLAASAEVDQEGNPTGKMFVDHRAPQNPEYEEILHQYHEIPETEYMKHLTDIGMSGPDAYDKAHAWATQRESAATEALLGKEGKEKYDQHWRDVAAVAKEPTDRPRADTAHTTFHGLDKDQLGQKVTGSDLESKLDKAVSQKQAGLLSKSPTALFIGPTASQAPREELEQAKKMQGQGFTNDAIKMHTGWFMDPTGDWKFEVPDTGARIKEENLARNKFNMNLFEISPRNKPAEDAPTQEHIDYHTKPMKLGDILEHPKLYKHYPSLEHADVFRTNISEMLSGTKGWYSAGPGAKYGNFEKEKFALKGDSPSELRSVLLHEVQHAIQYREGFETGGNTGQFEHSILPGIRKDFKPYEADLKKVFEDKGIDFHRVNTLWHWDTDQLSQYLKPGDKAMIDKVKKDPELSKVFAQYMKIKELMGGLESKAYSGYKSLAGEVEARNVQTRLDPAQRFFNPWETEDVPKSEQTFRKPLGGPMPPHEQSGHGLLQINPLEK